MAATHRASSLALRAVIAVAAAVVPVSPRVSSAAVPEALASLDSVYPSLDSLYVDLHRNPELSLREEQTAAKLARRMRALGLDVTERVGGNGVVAVLRNGAGPTVLVRTYLDALPIREETGLAHASTMTGPNAASEMLPVMHACGHDVHMTSWVGAAAVLAKAKNRWRGTIVFVGQPAEETLQGARAMVADGLFTRFPKPDFVIGLHVTNLLPSTTVGVISGPASAISDAVDITFFGKGGHGASPHLTIDPLLLAARAVVTLQTIVSREVSPFDAAVVTVGSFHSGIKRNIIPDEAKLELTVRSYDVAVQKRILVSIERIAKAEAAAAGAPREPLVVVHAQESSELVMNDPGLAASLTTALRTGLGESRVVPMAPVMSSEDFGVYGRVAQVPGVQLRIGSVEPAEFARLAAAGQVAPGVHTSKCAPDRERTIRLGVESFVLSVLELTKSGATPR